MKIQTRPVGSFARVGSAAPSWLEQNKAWVIPVSVAALAAAFVILAIWLWAGNRSTKAQALFNQAMEVYDSPLQQPGEPAMPDMKYYPSAAARAKVANPLFGQIADKYSWFKSGKNARYFAGLTAEDMGNNAAAEADLKQAASGSDQGLGTLAKMALASLYVQTGRASQAAALYREVIAHPTLTVSANAARLALAGSEETTNPQEARELYAKIKDSDKAGAAGEIAAEKLHAP